MLTKVLPALIAEHELFGVGREAEARIFQLITDGFDRKNGETGFLRSLLEELLRQADALGITEVQRVRRDLNDLGVFTCLKSFVDSLPHNVPHFILVDEVQNFFLLTKPDGTLDGPSIDQMRRCVACLWFAFRTLFESLRCGRMFKSFVGSSPVHCTWVVTGSSMATYWANLALAPVNGFSILTHLSSIHLPTRVGSETLERARAVLRREFESNPLPDPLLQFSEAHTVAELVFYVTEWDRLPAEVVAAKPALEFCVDTLADKVYPEVRRRKPFVQLLSFARCDAPVQIISDFARVLDSMDVATRLLVVQLVNSEIGVEEDKLPRGLLRYFRPYMCSLGSSSGTKLVYVDSPIVYAALAVRKQSAVRLPRAFLMRGALRRWWMLTAMSSHSPTRACLSLILQSWRASVDLVTNCPNWRGTDGQTATFSRRLHPMWWSCSRRGVKSSTRHSGIPPMPTTGSTSPCGILSTMLLAAS